MNKLLILALLLHLHAATAFASTIDRLTVPSAAMNKDIPVNVVKPQGYDENANATYPVVYLLHGAGDDDWSWLNNTSVTKLADQYGMILVTCSAQLSWYFDSPEDPSSQYETFVAKELVAYVDGHYHTKTDRLQRALLGCSMGGHGALFLAIRHQETFATAVSLSGGVDFRPFPDYWGISKVLGTEKDHADRWNDLIVLNQAKQLKDGDIAISMDCGVNDLFIASNRALHQQLLDQKVSHDYTERPGWHGWAYWAAAIPYQMLYLSNRFNTPVDAKK